MRRYFRSAVAAGILAAAPALAQNSPQPQFEIASVKPGGDIFSTRPNRSPGRIRWTTQVAYLIGYAYRLDFTRVSGAHLGRTYVIEATFEPNATDDQIRLMVQSLLQERFGMRCHRVAKEVEGYALSIAKGGSKLREAKGDDSYVAATVPEAGLVAITGRRAAINELAEVLQRALDVPVWDRTGLQGKYDFEFRYAQAPGAGFDSDAPPLAPALRDQLGLTLKKEKGPLETLVIDSIVEPSEN